MNPKQNFPQLNVSSIFSKGAVLKNIFNRCLMDKTNQSLQSKFFVAGNTLTDFYKEAQAAHKEAYAQGQKDAIDELVKYILAESGGDPRKLGTTKLIEFIENKVKEIQGALPQVGANIQTPSVTNEHASQMEFGGMSPMPNYLQNQEEMMGYNNQGMNMQQNMQQHFSMNQNQEMFPNMSNNQGFNNPNQPNNPYF